MSYNILLEPTNFPTANIIRKFMQLLVYHNLAQRPHLRLAKIPHRLHHVPRLGHRRRASHTMDLFILRHLHVHVGLHLPLLNHFLSLTAQISANILHPVINPARSRQIPQRRPLLNLIMLHHRSLIFPIPMLRLMMMMMMMILRISKADSNLQPIVTLTRALILI